MAPTSHPEHCCGTPSQRFIKPYSDTLLGNAQAQRLFESIRIEKKPGVESPRAYSDYTVTPPEPGTLPDGVILIDGLA